MQYTLIRSHRKTLALQIRENGAIFVRAPLKMPHIFIEKFLQEKSDWIAKTQEKIQKNPRKNYEPSEILEMKRHLQKYLENRVAEIWKKYDFLPPFESVKITKSEKQWWSCSAKNRLCFSYRLAEFLWKNPRFIDAVIVHELAHLQEKNHGKNFWNLVNFLMPDYHDAIRKNT